VNAGEPDQLVGCSRYDHERHAVNNIRVGPSGETDVNVSTIDKDRVAAVHSQQSLQGNNRATAIRARLRDPEADVADSDDPAGMVVRYRDRLSAGGHLALTHSTDDGRPQGLERVVDEIRGRGTARSHERVITFFHSGVDRGSAHY
jgi:hypothetical protein